LRHEASGTKEEQDGEREQEGGRRAAFGGIGIRSGAWWVGAQRPHHDMAAKQRGGGREQRELWAAGQQG